MENISSGIIREGFVKIKLAFEAEVCETERVKILEHWAETMTHSDVKVIETRHTEKMSAMIARINHPHRAR
ncbi:MAG: hypothetical protein J6V76_02940 [Bacteroidales bacterium]|nr:hypothetical protein [Bacteroidales bacterium]MBO7142046.1 hypothetical protein [Bacteroidales bacterium]